MGKYTVIHKKNGKDVASPPVSLEKATAIKEKCDKWKSKHKATIVPVASAPKRKAPKKK